MYVFFLNRNVILKCVLVGIFTNNTKYYKKLNQKHIDIIQIISYLFIFFIRN